MSTRRLRNVLFMLVLVAAFFASREASLRGEGECWACTGIFGETCETCQGGEDCATGCMDEPELEECTIYGTVCSAGNLDSVPGNGTEAAVSHGL